MDPTVYTVTGKIISEMSESLHASSTKALLAALRHSAGKGLEESREIWPIFFRYIPEEKLGYGGNVTTFENAVFNAVQLYAIHQQGKERSVHSKEKKSFAEVLRSIRGEDSTAMDRRFNTMVYSESIEEFSYHSRQLLKILKSRNKEATVNYAQLASDLYWYQMGYENRVRLSWARTYYKINPKKENTENE